MTVALKQSGPSHRSSSDRIAALAVSPWSIAATFGLAAAVLIAGHQTQLFPWVALVAFLAGWSAAWSP